MNRLAGLALAGFLVLAANGSASASFLSHGDHDKVAFGETITVDEGETAGDIVCAFCTVRVRGDLSGDMVTFFGTTELADGKAISGDVVVFGGGLKLGSESQVRGDLVLFAGDLEQAGSAVIHGDRVVLAGGGWLLLFLVPLLIPVGVIWLIVHLIRRGRYRFPAYPGGRY